MTSTADRLTSRAASFVLAFAMTSLSLLGVADCTPGAPECPKSLAIRSADFIIE